MHRSALQAALLFLAAPAAAEPVELGRYELAYPYPSPSGAEIAIQGNFDGRWQLYVMNKEGALRRAHVSDGNDVAPAWSPDGRRLAFVSDRSGNPDVHVLDVASGKVRAVAPHPGKDGHPKWSADGGWLVFNRTFDPGDADGDRGSAVLRVRPDGTGLEVLSDSPNIETFASFSPDGRQIVFVEWFPDAEGRPGRNGDLIVLDLATKSRRNITASPEFDGYPHWGPSGRWIYYSAVTEGGASGREMLLYRIRPDGGGRERLSPLDGVSEVRAIPAADGSALFYNRGSAGRTSVHRMALDAAPPTPPARP